MRIMKYKFFYLLCWKSFRFNNYISMCKSVVKLVFLYIVGESVKRYSVLLRKI